MNVASNNSSEVPEFGTTFEVNSYLAVNSCLLVFIAVPGLLLNGLLMITLAGLIAKKQGRAQWIIVLNIALAGLVTILGLAALSVSRLFLINNVQEGAEWACRISQAAVHISIAIRTAALAVLSVVMYIIIKHGLSKVKLYPLTAAIIILWMIVVISGIPYLTPAYEYKAFRKGILICDTALTRAAYVHISLSILFIDIPGRFISVFTVIAAAIHVKRRSVRDYNPIKKSFFRFSVVLLCINILVALVNIIATLGYVLPIGTSEDVAVLVWLNSTINIAICLPAFVAPVLMMIIFKPIWNAVKSLLTCQRCREPAHGAISMPVPKEAGLRLCIPNTAHV